MTNIGVLSGKHTVDHWQPFAMLGKNPKTSLILHCCGSTSISGCLPPARYPEKQSVSHRFRFSLVQCPDNGTAHFSNELNCRILDNIKHSATDSAFFIVIENRSSSRFEMTIWFPLEMILSVLGQRSKLFFIMKINYASPPFQNKIHPNFFSPIFRDWQMTIYNKLLIMSLSEGITKPVMTHS